jgi:hypothetical protein
MENNHNTNPLHNRQDKSKPESTQLQTIFQFLHENEATASMVELETGIHHKNICRYKSDLEKQGLLWETKKDICKRTGHKAYYLTTNPALISIDRQLKLL